MVAGAQRLGERVLDERLEREHRAACRRCACDAEIAGPSAVRTASTICSGSFVDARALRDDFEDAHEVADADAFVEQRLQHALDLAGGDVGAVQLVDHDRIGLLHDVDEQLHVLAAEQPARVAAHDLGEVRGDDRRAVDDGRAGDLGLVAELERHPRARAARTPARASAMPGSAPAVVAEHEHVVRRRFAAPDVDAVHADRVRARRAAPGCRACARAGSRRRARARACAAARARGRGGRRPWLASTRSMRSYAISSSSGSTRMSLARCSGESGESGPARLDLGFVGRGLARRISLVARQPGREEQQRRRRR